MGVAWFPRRDFGYRLPVEVIDDRYELLEVIASGGMATVWKARDTRLDRLVAVKRPHPGLPGDRSAERLGREARAAASLNHPNLITVYDFGWDETGPYLVMELVDGATLQDMAGLLESSEVVEMGARLADALATIHAAGIVHRDVKPANVIMSERGPLLTDFGIATDPNSTAELTQPGMVLATPSYAAPEVLGGEPPTPASDVYSLAVVIDELIRKTGATLGESVDHALAAALADSPVDRPDAAGLADVLGRGALTVSSVVPSEGATMIMEPTPSPPPSVTRSDTEDREPPPAWVWVAGILALLALGLIALGLANSGDDPPADAALAPPTLVGDTSTSTSTSTTTSSSTTVVTTTTVSSLDSRISDARNELAAVLSRPPRSNLNPREVEEILDTVDEGIRAALEGDFEEAEERLEEVEDRIEDNLTGEHLAEARAALYELAGLLGVELDDDDDDEDD